MNWYAPLDPDCPGARRDVYDPLDTMEEDPMTQAYGAPVDEFVEQWERKHRLSCKRCQEFGAANIGVV